METRLYHFARVWQPDLSQNQGQVQFFMQYRRRLVALVNTFAYMLTPAGFNFLISPKTSLDEVVNAFEELTAALLKTDPQRDREWQDTDNGVLEIRVISDPDQRLLEVAAIHFKPVAAGLCRDFEEWRHSSFAMLTNDDPTPLEREHVINWFGGCEAFRAFHQGYKLARRQKIL